MTKPVFCVSQGHGGGDGDGGLGGGGLGEGGGGEPHKPFTTTKG